VKKRRLRDYRLLVYLLSVVLIVAGCNGGRIGVLDSKDTSTKISRRVILEEEALRLYGIEAGEEIAKEAPMSTPQQWFPMQVWVSASVLPYDDPDPIQILPIYADSELGVASTWVGDLHAGSSVMLLSVHVDGYACFVEGEAIQGWEVQGWVACNRLLFGEPTPVAGFYEESTR
jgi:hypothetical protein